MSDPTATQIAADVTQPTYEVQIWNGSTWVSQIANVEHVSSGVQITGELGGFAFGASRGLSAEVTIDKAAFGVAWKGKLIRIGYGFETSDKVVKFVGVITGRARGRTSGTWRCEGLDVLIEGQKIWSPLFVKRPIATKTTISSIEDPSNPGYRGGPINYLFWVCGGRPYEQAGSYPNALFYYSCEQALLGPKYYWQAGENPWNELNRLVQVCGGQVYQDDSGVMRYASPFSLATGTPTYTFTDAALTAAQRVSQNAGPYEDCSEDSSLEQTVTTVTCTFTTRQVQGFQTVYEQADPLDRPIRPGETITLTCDTQLPIYDANRVAVEVDAGIVRPAQKPSAAQLVATITDRKATRFTVTLENTAAEPISVYAVRLRGRPISAGPPETVFFSASGELDQTRALEVPDSPLIQSRSHAERLCRMLWDFHVGDHGLITLAGCPMDTRRYVGEPVFFTCSAWGETNTPCRIVAIRPTGDGFMDVDLGRSADLPVASDFFIIGQAYGDSAVRQLAY